MNDTNLTLPVAPNSTTLKLLQRARMMFTHATEHAATGTEFDGMVAILGLDSTVEYVLRIVASHLDLETLTGKSFDIIDLASLAGTIDKALKDKWKKQLPYVGEIKLLRQTRNLVQHGASSPLADLQRFSTITERFFDRVMKEIFGFPLKELKTSAVINDSTVKKHMERAEAALESKQWLECVVASRDAFENAYFERILHSNVALDLYPAIIKVSKVEGFPIWALNTIMEALVLSQLGINNPDYQRFHQYLRHIPGEYQPDELLVTVLMQRPWERDDAVFCYAFVSDSLLRWQSADRSPLYTPKFDREYIYKASLGGVDVSEVMQGEIVYALGDDRFNLWIVNRELKEKLEALQEGQCYSFVWEEYVDGAKSQDGESKVELVISGSFLITCNPPRWIFVFWYRPVNNENTK